MTLHVPSSRLVPAIEPEDRLEALGNALAHCLTVGDLNDLMRLTPVRTALRRCGDPAARLIRDRYRELTAPPGAQASRGASPASGKEGE